MHTRVPAWGQGGGVEPAGAEQVPGESWLNEAKLSRSELVPELSGKATGGSDACDPFCQTVPVPSLVSLSSLLCLVGWWFF